MIRAWAVQVSGESIQGRGKSQCKCPGGSVTVVFLDLQLWLDMGDYRTLSWRGENSVSIGPCRPL